MSRQAAARPLELTDLLCRVDPHDGSRLPVPRKELLAALENTGQRHALRLARKLPTQGEHLDADAIDALLLRVHVELQRLGEELQLPRRLAEQLRRWSEPLLASASPAPVRVVDVGCGLGHVVRWLAAHEALGPHVELVGVDQNATLIARAESLAATEGLACRFITGDAFAPGVAVDDPQRTILVSSGLLHHIAPEDLPAFFAAHEALSVDAFAHFDVDPSRWATAGAWVFHQARMREPISAARRRALRAAIPPRGPAADHRRQRRPELSGHLRGWAALASGSGRGAATRHRHEESRLMPDILVLTGLVVVAGLDGAFAGFRASCGRTGLIRHRTQDRRAARSGLLLLSLLLVPAGALMAIDLLARPDRLDTYRHAGQAMLEAYLPYGLLVLLALLGYLTLRWRRRFLASALLLGPLTLVRPLVAVAGGVAASWTSHDPAVTLVALAATWAVLLVEPLAGRPFRRQQAARAVHGPTSTS